MKRRELLTSGLAAAALPSLGSPVLGQKVAPVPPKPVVGGSKLLAYFQEARRTGNLFVTAYTKGQGWSPPRRVPTRALISKSPSVVEYYSSLFIFYQGAGEDGKLWCEQWTVLGLERRWLVSSDMSESPSAVVYENKVYCFYQNGRRGGWLRYAVFDGSNWTADISLGDGFGLMSKSPGATVYNGKICCLRQGDRENGDLGESIFRQGKWTSNVNVPNNKKMSESPAAVAFGDWLLIFTQGGNKDGRVWCTGQNDNASPSVALAEVNTISMSNSASSTVHDGEVYVAVQGAEETGVLRYAILSYIVKDKPFAQALGWSFQGVVPGVTISESPCLISTSVAQPVE